jgi:dihydroorotase-like cyclic amidohydrolase
VCLQSAWAAHLVPNHENLIRNGRVIDPARGFDQVCDVAWPPAVWWRSAGPGFVADREIDASGQWVLPGLVDLAVRLREPGHEHEGMLQSEMAAAVAGGVTSLVCPPDTDRCSTSRAWWKCSSSVPRSSTSRVCSPWAR